MIAVEVTVASAGAAIALLLGLSALLTKVGRILRKVQRVHDDVLGDPTAPDGDPRREPLRHVVGDIGEKVDAASASAERAREESRLSREENKAQHRQVSERIDGLATQVEHLATAVEASTAQPQARPSRPRTTKRSA